MSFSGVAHFKGGTHDGERITPDLGEELPDRLFAISFDDGTTFARTGEQFTDADGNPVTVFAFDGDGALVRRSQVLFGRLPEDAPWVERPE